MKGLCKSSGVVPQRRKLFVSISEGPEDIIDLVGRLNELGDRGYQTNNGDGVHFARTLVNM